MNKKGVRMRAFFGVFVALVSVWAMGADFYPQEFMCTGETKGEICWLTDARLYSTASWHFRGLVPGQWTLVLEALSDAYWCAPLGCDLDVTVQVFWRAGLGEPWNWEFVVLRVVEPEASQVRGEVPLRVAGSELFVLVRRALLCQPFLGFSQVSAHLRAPAGVEEVSPPPPPPLPPTPPTEPPPSPPPVTCRVGALFACGPGPMPQECIPPGVDLSTVPRISLADTFGPADAQALDIGHYRGEMTPNDYQDWYKFASPKGEARLVYLETSGDLKVDVFLVHDPCGTDLAVCRDVSGAAVIHAPCQAGVECVTIPDGLTECFRGPICGFFLRIVRVSGSGQYIVSILPAEIGP